MQKSLLLILGFFVCLCSLSAQKKVYIPEDLQQMNLEADSSQWCWKRSAETRDLIFMWEKGFGNNENLNFNEGIKGQYGHVKILFLKILYLLKFLFKGSEIK